MARSLDEGHVECRAGRGSAASLSERTISGVEGALLLAVSLDDTGALGRGLRTMSVEISMVIPRTNLKPSPKPRPRLRLKLRLPQDRPKTATPPRPPQDCDSPKTKTAPKTKTEASTKTASKTKTAANSKPQPS
ncbi:hypothetical protein [Mobiluncus mulieris]|uniref:hypothetical protein n=1 Tax=Mobiluncus mulieris TaxID=2052 RepID=UPI002093466A|nr:hypothetical protein [Mobiluncus mulieris]